MEARAFFMNGPMQTIDVSGSPLDWADVLVDLEEMRKQIHYYRSHGCHNDDSTYEYEAATSSLIDALKTIGVER